MKSIAFIFSHAPHGSSAGREGLDAVLAASAFSEKITLFFIGDGVLQLMTDQCPEEILARNYIATFGILPLYDVSQYYICEASLAERGLPATGPHVLPATVLSSRLLRAKLAQADCIMMF